MTRLGRGGDSAGLLSGPGGGWATPLNPTPEPARTGLSSKPAPWSSLQIKGHLPAAYAPTGRFSVPLISHVTDGLWIGGCVQGVALPGDFDFVLSLHPRAQYAIGLMTRRVEIPAADSLTQDTDVFREPAQLVALRVKAGAKVLVHCQAGLNRSGLTAALALTRLGYTPAAALRLLRTRRSRFVLCNPVFRAALLSGDRA